MLKKSEIERDPNEWIDGFVASTSQHHTYLAHRLRRVQSNGAEISVNWTHIWPNTRTKTAWIDGCAWAQCHLIWSGETGFCLLVWTRVHHTHTHSGPTTSSLSSPYCHFLAHRSPRFLFLPIAAAVPRALRKHRCFVIWILNTRRCVAYFIYSRAFRIHLYYYRTLFAPVHIYANKSNTNTSILCT